MKWEARGRGLRLVQEVLPAWAMRSAQESQTATQFRVPRETKADKIPTAKRKCDYWPDPAPCLLQCVYTERLTMSTELRGTYRGI